MDDRELAATMHMWKNYPKPQKVLEVTERTMKGIKSLLNEKGLDPIINEVLRDTLCMEFFTCYMEGRKHKAEDN